MAADRCESVLRKGLSLYPTTEVFSHIQVADGRVRMLPDGVGCFAGDLSEEGQKVVRATARAATIIRYAATVRREDRRKARVLRA
jgi:hypothetical protein